MKQKNRQLIDGSAAIAQAVALSRPEVISAYPITPQTHIVEALEKYSPNKRSYRFIQADSEFAAASIALGASAVGARSYTATSSQGLVLMSEVLHNIAGLRLPVVITCANRAISGPINIWNDHSDAMSMRDSGWIMLFAKDNQEALDLQVIAFAIAERSKLPAAVNVDGFILTHAMEEVIIPAEDDVRRFLGERKTDKDNVLDTGSPLSIGTLFPPYQYSRYKLELASGLEGSKEIIKSQAKRYSKLCQDIGSDGILRYAGPAKPEIVIIAMGSVTGTIQAAIDGRKDKKKIGLIQVISYRPFPREEIYGICKRAKKIFVLEKSSASNKLGPLGQDVATSDISVDKIINEAVGLGGKDISVDDINAIINQSKI